MRALSSLGIGLSLVSGFLLLALIAELYYLFLWKKRVPNREMENDYQSPIRELLYIFCWKKPSFLRSTALNPREVCTSAQIPNGSDDAHIDSGSSKDFLIPFGSGEESMEAELMRLHSLSGPPRFLFTIKEETKEDLESESGRSGKGSRGGSLSDLLLPAETPFLTPLSSPPFFTPPLTPMDCYRHLGFNPLFESSRNDDLGTKVRSSPPPKFKFLKDAEEKLYRKTLMEEALKAQKANFGLVEDVPKVNQSSYATSAGTDASYSPSEEEDGSFITIVIGKNREKGHHLHCLGSSQVNPLPSSSPIQRRA
ncbi:uncharacterized protein LOC110018680 [Phalaenopsis equestris]|uniref:uncharacterized protein LOC110018680 n=1 Tax=Phalaenopsis equestris TaxID=78828 RepID=UPI0009E4C2AB|nr:uncharacterized protein LOC110018680 [Phalaenopsis equestris]